MLIAPFRGLPGALIECCRKPLGRPFATTLIREWKDNMLLKLKKMILAVNLSAYADLVLPPDTEMTPENLKQLAMQRNLDGEVTFKPEWETTNSFRIVSCSEDDDLVLEDVPIEPSYHDVGTNFNSWMNGHQSLADAIHSSAAMLPAINAGIAEVFTGYVKLPGAGRIQVDFECRKGASSEEMDLAFLNALEEVVELGYVPLGEQPAKGATPHDVSPEVTDRPKG